jgi:hypothetical protein
MEIQGQHRRTRCATYRLHRLLNKPNYFIPTLQTFFNPVVYLYTTRFGRYLGLLLEPVTVKRGSLYFYCLPMYGFCDNMPEDGRSIGCNM